jgi:gliding motility-associated-like protein
LTETDTLTGCSATDSVTVSMVQSAVADAGPDVAICQGDTVQIGTALIEGQEYRWDPGDSLTNDTVPNPFAFPDTSTVYTVKTSYEGCDTITDDVMVTVHPLPDVKVQDGEGRMDSIEITQGAEARLVASGAVQYDWMPEWGLNHPGVHDPLASPNEDTLYRVKGTDMNGCTSSDSIHITVIAPDVWAPNAFTPDGDGRNDRFYIRAQGVEEFELSIFDRSGRLVFKTERIEEGWDGTVQGSGEELPQGAYVYRATGELSDGTAFNEKGMINLIR